MCAGRHSTSVQLTKASSDAPTDGTRRDMQWASQSLLAAQTTPKPLKPGGN